MPLGPGSRLGPYEILSAIGAGGMGEVYRAIDTSLGRQVAIKVLPEAFAQDTERLARFEREAKTLAALNHPNIAAIHGFEKSGGVQALVMELVEGEDLSQRIARGPIPLDEALPIAKQIAEALEAAHEQGIIHRDLKPANIKVRPDGTVKVLDFGLAKLAESGIGAADNAALSNSPTITSPAMMTGVGMLLGTAAYMSPEQARGKAVDKRADIWAFGAVLFEMLTGQRAFPGDDVTDTIVSVISKEPNWSALPSATPAGLRRVLGRCLQKGVRARLRDIGEARVHLEDLLSGVPGEVSTVGSDAVAAQTTASAIPSAKSGRLAWMAALAVAVVGMVAMAVPTVQHLRETSPLAPPETRTEIVTPATDQPTSFALSPDGRQIVFVASGDGGSRLWLRSLATTTAQPLVGTEGAVAPFWSPDSRFIGFFSGAAMKRLDLGGGAPQTLARVEGSRGATWNADGVVLFSPNTTSPLFRVPASGGQAVALTKLDRQGNHRFPFFLPDGRQFLFYASGTAETTGIYLGSLDSAQTVRLTPADTSGVYLSSGWLLWVRSGALVAQRLDLMRKALTGSPVTLSDSAAAVSVSTTGLVAYRSGGFVRRQLAWFDRTGKALGVVGEPENASSAPELSPDGRRIAIDLTREGNRDVWVMDLARGGLTRFTFDAAPDGFPVWSPDGSRIAFESTRNGSWDIWLKPSNGVGMEELLLGTPSNEWPLGWSKDGRFLLYYQDGGKTGADLWALPMTGDDRKPILVANTPFDEFTGQFSPDGRWVAYDTNESGRSEIVVQPFPTPTAKWQVSTSGGMKPRWRTDGKELYFITPDGTLMVSPVAGQASAFEAGTPGVLFPTPIRGSVAAVPKQQYAVSSDGRFLINTTGDDDATGPITLLMNWNPEGKK